MKSNKAIFTEIYGTYQDSTDYLIKSMLSHEISVNEYYKTEYKLISETLDKLTAFQQMLQLQYQLDAIEFEYYIKMYDKVYDKVNTLESLQDDIKRIVNESAE